jgi:hypothetical protein
VWVCVSDHQHARVMRMDIGLNYKTTQQTSSWLLLDYRVRFNSVCIVIRDILRYERIENSSFRNVKQLYSIFDSISVVARCLIITSYIISVVRVSINYTYYYQRTGVRRREIGTNHLRLVLCVPNISIEIPLGLPHQIINNFLGALQSVVNRMRRVVL